jgi:hypothetical protein
MSSSILKSLRSLILPLREEIRICKLVIKQNNLQHRRTLYWKSFKQVVALSQKVEKSLSLLLEDSSLEVHYESFDKALKEIADVCKFALKRSISLCATRIATPHKGAGFASIASIILASTARFVDLEYKIRAKCLGLYTRDDEIKDSKIEIGIDFVIDGSINKQDKTNT